MVPGHWGFSWPTPSGLASRKRPRGRLAPIKSPPGRQTAKRRVFENAPFPQAKQPDKPLSLGLVSGPPPTSATTLFPFVRLVDPQITPAKLRPIERTDRGCGFLVLHLNEAKATRPTGFAIRQKCYLVNGPVSAEQLTNLVFRRTERQVAYVDSLQGSNSLVAPDTINAGSPIDLEIDVRDLVKWHASRGGFKISPPIKLRSGIPGPTLETGANTTYRCGRKFVRD